MTAGTIAAELTPVGIARGMTAHTRIRGDSQRFEIATTTVTGVTSELTVTTFKREISTEVMIKTRVRPHIAAMAIFATVPKTLVVNVYDTVATYAGSGHRLGFESRRMATRTRQVSVFSSQLEIGGRMVEISPGPLLLLMAIAAGRSIGSEMDVDAAVTANAALINGIVGFIL